MAKAEKSSLQKVNESQDELTLQNAKTQATQIMDEFAKVGDADLTPLTADYLEFEQEKTYNMVFTAMTKFTGANGGEVDAVELVDEEGNKFINGNTVLVKSLKRVQQMPCLVRIVTGKKVKAKTGNGFYLDMEVFVLSKTVKS